MINDLLNSNPRTIIMGILNVTPNSFYDGGKFMDAPNISSQLKKISNADIIDVGAESSKPGSLEIDYRTEIERLNIVLPLLEKNKIYSIDTYKPEVAEFALNNGFHMVNDIKGGYNNNLLEIVSDKKSPIILMHMQGKPSNMQNNPKYENLMDDLLSFFDERINKCIKYGIDKKNIVIDPGLGFGKSINDNDQIITQLHKFKRFNLPILIGLSRKSFLSYNNNEPNQRLESSLSFGSIAIMNGANIMRVHDVDESIEVFSLVDRMLRVKS